MDIDIDIGIGGTSGKEPTYFLFFPKRYQRGAGVSWLQPANTPFL